MIATSYFLSVIFFLSLGTLLIKCSFMLASDKITLSDDLKKLFSYIPAAVLPAIITPMVVFHEGAVELFYGKERFVVLLFATLVSYFTKSMIATVAFGLAALYFLTQLM